MGFSCNEMGSTEEQMASASHPSVPEKWLKLPPRRTLNDLKAEPEPRWLIDGLLPSWPLAYIYGPSQSGKTFIALDWALSIAADVPWQGRRVEWGPVVYMAGEGGYGIAKRVEAWAQGKVIEPGWEKWFTVLTGAVDMCSTEAVRAFAERELSFDECGVSLVVIDTLSWAMPGRDDASKVDMSLVTTNAKELSEILGCTVLIVHHTGHGNQDRARGHSSLPADADARFGVVGNLTKSHDVKLRVEKLKDAEDGWDLSLRFVRAGESLVVTPGPAGEPSEAGMVARPRLKDPITLALLGLLASGPQRFARLKEAAGAHQSTVSARLKKLMEAGRVIHDGTFYQLVH